MFHQNEICETQHFIHDETIVWSVVFSSSLLSLLISCHCQRARSMFLKKIFRNLPSSVGMVIELFRISVGQSVNIAPIVSASIKGRRITPSRHEIKPSPTYAIAAFEVFGWNCPSNFITTGFKMMEGLSGISPGTWGQRGAPWSGFNKEARRGWFARRELLPAWRASTRTRKYVNPRNPPRGRMAKRVSETIFDSITGVLFLHGFHIQIW